MTQPQWKSVEAISRMLNSASVVTNIVNNVAEELVQIPQEKLVELYRFRSTTIPIKNRHLEINFSQLSDRQKEAVIEGVGALGSELGFEIGIEACELGNPTDLEYCLIISEPIDDGTDGGGDDDSDRRVDLPTPSSQDDFQVPKVMAAHG